MKTLIKQDKAEGHIEYYFQDKLIALILRNSFMVNKTTFVTPETATQQIGFIVYPAGSKIQAHIHVRSTRIVDFTCETLLIKEGKVLINFYDSEKSFLGSEVLSQGDLIYLAEGGHGFEVLESAVILEVKQGPYMGEADKIRFSEGSQI